MSKEKYDKERETVPVINLVSGDAKLSKEFVDRMVWNQLNKKKKDVVAWHKEVWGKQSYCYFNGEYRFWVWDFHDWRIWVSNRKGTSIEVDPGFDLEQAMFVARYYWDKMGL